MQNIPVIGILAAIAVTVIATLIHRSGQKGCCGSAGSYKPRKKKLKTVVAVKVFTVDGMHCQNCANRVTEVINDIPHAAATVDLESGTATVRYEEAVPDALITSRIERAGYRVTGVA